MALRSKRSGQAPLISQMCVSTEKAILAIFSPQPTPGVDEPGASGRSQGRVTGFQMRF